MCEDDSRQCSVCSKQSVFIDGDGLDHPIEKAMKAKEIRECGALAATKGVTDSHDKPSVRAARPTRSLDVVRNCRRQPSHDHDVESLEINSMADHRSPNESTETVPPIRGRSFHSFDGVS